MDSGHDMKLDIAHARQRDLIAAGERARSSQPSAGDADARRRPRSRAPRRLLSVGFLLRRAGLSAVREQDPC